MSTGPWIGQYTICDVCDECVHHKNGGEVLVIHFGIGQVCQWCKQSLATCRIRWKLWEVRKPISIVRDNRD